MLGNGAVFEDAYRDSKFFSRKMGGYKYIIYWNKYIKQQVGYISPGYLEFFYLFVVKYS